MQMSEFTIGRDDVALITWNEDELHEYLVPHLVWKKDIDSGGLVDAFTLAGRIFDNEPSVHLISIIVGDKNIMFDITRRMVVEHVRESNV